MKGMLAWVAALVFASGFAFIPLDLVFGEPATTEMDDYFIQNGQEETGANNIVTSVVFDYRAVDTLGEATVLFTAVLGIGMLFRKLNEGEQYGNE